MNRFVTIFRTFVSLKVSVVLSTPVILVLLGIISGSQSFLPSLSAFAAPTCYFHTAKPGDTPGAIEVTYHTAYQGIAQLKYIKNVNLISPDQSFCILPSGIAHKPSRVVHARHTPTKITRPATNPTPVSPPVVPTPAPPVPPVQPTPSSSVTGMIEQIFGVYAPEAINI